MFSARIVGHVMWWVFVVSALFAGGITWWRVHESVGASFGGGLGGWTIYTPYLPVTGTGYVDLAFSPGPEWWQNPAVYALAAFVLVVVAAIVDAFASRRLVVGIITVVTPFAALTLFVLATPGAIDGVYLHSTVSLTLVLVGVAIRELWMRAGVPPSSRVRRQGLEG
ncbi:hypothetical protein [Gordonia terrae]|uniref:hypothetical protein n=1 Tax=Gordonia terrae TaxID=2055 RepID=UPI003F6B1D9C